MVAEALLDGEVGGELIPNVNSRTICLRGADKTEPQLLALLPPGFTGAYLARKKR